MWPAPQAARGSGGAAVLHLVIGLLLLTRELVGAGGLADLSDPWAVGPGTAELPDMLESSLPEVVTAASGVPRLLQSEGPFVRGLLPDGTGLVVQLQAGRTLSAVDGGSLELLAGEVILGLSIELPADSLFNVAAARVRVVIGELTREEARAGECAPGKLGPAGEETVGTPLSAKYGAAIGSGQGVPRLEVGFSSGAAFKTGGMFHICFTDDGSYSAGHADLVMVDLDVQAYVTNRLPAGTGVMMTFETGVHSIVQDGGELHLSSGEGISKITLELPLGSVLDVGSARIKAVDANMTREQALTGACAPGSDWDLGPESLDEPLSGAYGTKTLHARGDRQVNTTMEPVTFHLAGRFRLCFSDDGSFSTDHVDLISATLQVDGILDVCNDLDCLATRTFRCHALLGIASAADTCVLPLEGVLGPLGRASWSSRIEAVYGGDGMPLPLETPACGSTPADPDAFCTEGVAFDSAGVANCSVGGNRSISLTVASRVNLPPAMPLSISSEARTNAVCYCTGARGCDASDGEGGFYQQIGLVQIFSASVMTPGEYSCETSASGVLASIPFVSCVYCPPGGCPFYDSKGSRLMFSRQPEPWDVPALPAWDPEHSCRHATHETFLLPPASVASRLDGGPRSDIKRFRPDDGYSLPNWPAFVPKGNWLDICLCLNCTSYDAGQGEWFKVGHVAVLDAALAASAEVPGSSSSAPPRQVGQRGQLSISRSLLPYRDPIGVLGLAAGGGVRLASMSITEDASVREACQKNRPVEVVGLNNNNASTYSGTIRGDRIVFDGGVQGKDLAFPSVSTVVVCYCPQPGGLDEETGQQICNDSPEWVPVGALVIAGPLPNQRWIIPTFKVFRFEYLGVDLGPRDKLRLIDMEERCEDFPTPLLMCTSFNDDPIKGHRLCDSWYLSSQRGIMSTTTLSSRRVGCDELNKNCKSVAIDSLQVTDTGLRVEFKESTFSGGGLGDLGLKAGDTIVLGSGVLCGEDCSQAMLDMAKGFLGFAGLESYLPMDDRGAILRDEVGLRTGSKRGSPSAIPGKFGEFAYRFATEQAFTAGTDAPVEVSEPWTLAIWVQTEQQGWHTICGAADDNAFLGEGEVEIGITGFPWTPGELFLRQAGTTTSTTSITTTSSTTSTSSTSRSHTSTSSRSMTSTTSSATLSSTTSSTSSTTNSSTATTTQTTLTTSSTSTSSTTYTLSSTSTTYTGPEVTTTTFTGTSSTSTVTITSTSVSRTSTSTSSATHTSTSSVSLTTSSTSSTTSTSATSGTNTSSTTTVSTSTTSTSSISTTASSTTTFSNTSTTTLTSTTQTTSTRTTSSSTRTYSVSNTSTSSTSSTRTATTTTSTNTNTTTTGTTSTTSITSTTSVSSTGSTSTTSATTGTVTSSTGTTSSMTTTTTTGEQGLRGKHPMSTWTHVAVVYGGRMSGTLRFYLNGSLVQEQLGVRLNPSRHQLTCGGLVSEVFPSGGQRAVGTIDLDEMRWYNVPLSHEDVLALATAADGGVKDRQVNPGAAVGIALTSEVESGQVFDIHHGGFASALNPPKFDILPSGGQWARTNRGVTRAELMTNQPQRVQVCWERDGRAAPAGLIDFTSPATLDELGVWITQKEWSRASPFVLSFKTATRESAVGQRYETAEGYMSLVITFLNQRALRHLASSASGPFLTSLNPRSDEWDEANQITCGQLFRELWSSDLERGFPLAKGCFYRNLDSYMRELTIVFEKRNGLSPQTSYQIVMNGFGTNEMLANQELFFISSNDAIEGYRYSAMEVGQVFSNEDNLFMLGAGSNDARFGDIKGLELIGGDPEKNLVTLEDGTSKLQFQFMGGEYSTAKISRGNILSLWLQPLTAWQLPTDCADKTDRSASKDAIRIHCFVVVGKFRRCGEVVRCKGMPVVPHSPHVPKIEIEMPPNMNDLFGTNMYQMDVYNLKMPDSGVLPHRLMVQIADNDNARPNYRVAATRFYAAPTTEFMTLARVMTSPTDGLEPFEGVATHLLYVKLQLPVAIRGFDRSLPKPNVRPDSSFTVTAPPGFRVIAATSAPHGGEGLGMYTVTEAGDAASRLNASQRHSAPTGFGTPNLAGWKFFGRDATYTLQDRSLIPALTSLVIGFRVYPGNKSLPITDTLNLWSVQVSSPGDHNVTTTSFSAKFYRSGVGGVPVLGRLQYALVQPTNPMLSPDDVNVVENTLSIFFKAVTSVTAGGSVDVEAPVAFDFGQECNVAHLDDRYYVTGPATVLNRLPTILRCEVLSKGDTSKTGTKNLARIHVDGPLKGELLYGFQITVINPSLANLSKAIGADDPWSAVDWNLTTRGPEGSPVASTFGGAAGAADGTGSWRLVNKTIPQYSSVDEALAVAGPAVAVSLSSWLPFTIQKVAATATVVMMLELDFFGFMEVSAPVGFEWLAALLYKKPGFPWNTTHQFETLPSNVSSNSQGAMLRFQQAVYLGGVRYGFEAPIYVPNFGPVTSNPTFFFSLAVANPIGPSVPEGQSAVVFASPVRAIVDASARATNRLPGQSADLLLKLRIATAVENPSHLKIDMPPGFAPETSTKCHMRPWPGELSFSPSDPVGFAHCSFDRTLDVTEHRNKKYDQYHVILTPSIEQPLQPGLLQFRIKVINPPYQLSDFYVNAEATRGLGECGDACWVFTTRTQDGVLIDGSQDVASVPPPATMAVAEVMDEWPEASCSTCSKRSDRPGSKSRLVFKFSVGASGHFSRQDLMPAGKLELIGPSGIVIPTRCYSTVETRVTNLFGTLFNATKKGVDVWPVASPVTDCEGHGETAIISISPGLIAGDVYAFAIDLRNPFVQPLENNWTIMFQDHFSVPFPSFKIWAFSDLDIWAFAENSGPSCYRVADRDECTGAGKNVPVPMMLTFRTQNSIKTDAELHITAPLDFAFNATPGAELIEGDKQTRCILREYTKGNLSSVPYTWRLQERDCVIADRGSPIDGSGTGDMRTVRIIPRYIKNEFDLRPPKEITPKYLFTLDLWVHPPSTFRPREDWHLQSYDKFGNELDINTVLGWEVKRVMTSFEHSNTGGVNKFTRTAPPQVTAGLSYIPNFVIDFVLPGNAWLQDTLVLTAPRGFQLQLLYMAPNSPGSCIERRVILPAKAASLEPEATRPSICNSEVMTIPLRNFGRAIQSGQLARMMLEIYNPESPPIPEKNYWKLEHINGISSELQTSAIADSWAVIPVLFDTGSAVIGQFRAAGSETTIYFDFTTVQSSSELQINALVPTGFQFEGSYAVAMINERRSVPQILSATFDAIRLVILVERYDKIRLTISRVTLSEVPGISRWHLSTWELPEEDMLGTPYIRDEVFMQGFLVPGLIETLSASGQTGREGAAILGKRSDLTIDIVSSAAIIAGSDFSVSVTGAGHFGFKLFSEKAEIWMLDWEEGEVPVKKVAEWFCKDIYHLFPPNYTENETLVNLTQDIYLPHPDTCEWDSTRQEMIANLNLSNLSHGNSSRFADRIALKFIEDVPAGRYMRLTFQVQNPEDRTNFLLESWQFDVTEWISNSSVLELITTNDGAYIPLSVVTQLPITPDPVPSHTAPLTRIQVIFRLDALDSGAEAFTITAPLGFSFPKECKVPPEENKTNNVDEMRCLPMEPSETGRSRVRVDCVADRSSVFGYDRGLGVLCLKQVPTIVYVETPSKSPEKDNVWFVEAIDVIGENFTSVGDRLGRGTLNGFEILNMGVQVVYGAVAAVPVDVGVAFESRVEVPAGGQVLVIAPEELRQFSCVNKRGQLQPVSLGAISSCESTLNPPSVRITLNETVPPGQHLVIIPAETSSKDPKVQLNVFDVFLLAPDGSNLDVSLSVPGEPVQQGLRASVWPLWWTQIINADTTFDVTVPIEIIDDVDVPVYGVVIDFPMNPDFELASTDIAVTTAFGSGLWLRDDDEQGTPFDAEVGGDTVLLRLDKALRLRTGLTLIRFTVKRPVELPRYNFWRVALCGDRMMDDGSGCSLGLSRAERGDAVLSVFALAGFNPYDEGIDSDPWRTAAGDSLRTEASVTAWLLLSILVMRATGR
eukprot:TRINITY_DN32821_c0_g1_i1.p1 TRINITY_DN32821_c0_g1~~TRINITY_DN32821_c0_g1_i1.p1  ORF type:complete len:3996 (-),score=741.57 TRINITY_DN32821_c0_g1_i1:75-12062(-)